MEIDADKMGLQLMKRAGLDPAYIAKHNNGIMYKITFGYTGPYMRNNARIKFLEQTAQQE